MASRALASRQGVNAILPRLVIAMLVVVLIGATACSGRREKAGANAPPPTPAEPPRIGIMTGSEAQGGEDYRAAEKIAHRYPRRVMHITFPDNFPSESVTVVAQLSGLAGESKLKSIVVGQAIPGSVAAARSIRALRSDVRLGFVTPRDDPDSVAAACDLAIGPDEAERAQTIAVAARDMGARSFVHYSFPRHLAEPLLAGQRNLLRSECARRGLRFTAVIAPDPAGPEGPSAARDFVTRDVPRELERLGPGTAFYTTCDALQAPLIRAILAAHQGYLVEQALPGPSVGYAAALDLELPASDEPDSLHATLRRRLAALGMSGHFGTWTDSVEGVAMRAMGSLMLDALDQKADPHDSATVRRYLEAEARGPVRMRRSRPGANQWMILLDRVTY